MADITITNLRVAPGAGPRVPTTVKAFPLSDFLLAGGETAMSAQSPYNGGSPFKSADLEPDGAYYAADDFTLPATTDSPDNPNGARWGLFVFDANERLMFPVAGLESFQLDHTTTTQDAEDIVAFNAGAFPALSPSDRTVSGSLTVGENLEVGGDTTLDGDLNLGGVLTGNAGGLTNIPGTPSGPAFESLESDASLWAKYQADGGGVGRFDLLRGDPGASVFGFNAAGNLDVLQGVTGDALTTLKAAVNPASVFSAGHPDYDAVPDDDTVPDNGARIAACIADAVTWGQANGGKVTVRIPDGEYFLNDALSTANDCYAQIPLPKLAVGTNKVHLTIEPESAPGYGIPFQTPGVGAAVLLHSTLTGQAFSDTPGAGTPCVMGGPDPANGETVSDWSWLSIHVRGVSIRTPGDPTLAGFNFSLLIHATVEDFRADVEGATGFPADYDEPTNPWAQAVIMPMRGTDGMDYRGTCMVAGFYGGFGLAELTEQTGVFYVYRCVVGLVLQENFHAAHVNHAVIVNCPYGLAAVDPVGGPTEVPALASTYRNAVLIDLVSFEDGNAGSPAWAQPVAHFYDPTSRLAGRITYHRIVGGTGSTIGLLFAGAHHARNVQFVDLVEPDYTPNVVYGRLNGQASAALTTKRPQVNQGVGWELPAASGTETYTSFIYQATGGIRGAVTSPNLNVIESGVADCIISAVCTFNPTSSGSIGLVARYASKDSFWQLEWTASTGVARLLKKTAADTYANMGDETVAPVAGTYVTLVIVLAGNVVSAYVDGELIASVTDAHNASSTKHGLAGYSNTALVTNFKVSLQ